MNELVDDGLGQIHVRQLNERKGRSRAVSMVEDLPAAIVRIVTFT
jgi:hypothetical protein